MSVGSPDDTQSYPPVDLSAAGSSTASVSAANDSTDYAASVDVFVDSAETVAFLRRLSSFISVGQNAVNLQQAAALIEHLGERTSHAEQMLLQREDQTSTYVEMCRAYEVMLDRRSSEIATLNARLAWQIDDAAKARADLQLETERLSAEVARAQVAQANAAADLEELRTSLAALGDSAVIMPVATLHALGIQFEVLSNQFARNGDLISQVMSEIGRCAIDRVMVDRTPEPTGTDHIGTDFALAPDLLRMAGV